MPRLTNLDDVLFPVEEQPVFTILNTVNGEKRISIPEKKAIVNRISGHVLGVVSRGYRLVSNREALDMAHDCCCAVFPDTKPGEWGVRTTDAPASGGHCFFDLIHNSTALDFAFVPAKDRPDAYGPFIRVTNSYNGLRALAFDIGYYRKVCKNGLILPKSVIRFKFTHMKNYIGETIKFEIAHEKLVEMKADIGKSFNVIKDYGVKRNQFEPLMQAVLLIHKPRNAKPGTRMNEDWDKLEAHIKEMCDRYAKELGENAYAVFNAITEFASQPPENRCVYRDRHGFQRRAGSWLTDFTRDCDQLDFTIEKHIERIAKGEGNGDGTEDALHGRHVTGEKG
ncbi:MAG: DUF932 domain-containing protein [Victivallales bacterium]